MVDTKEDRKKKMRHIQMPNTIRGSQKTAEGKRVKQK